MKLQRLRRLIQRLDRGEKVSRVDFQWMYNFITELETRDARQRRANILRGEQFTRKDVPGD